MAVDTEAKRWSMLRIAGGTVAGIVFNPTGSDAETVIERATLLGLYGGIDFDSPVTTVKQNTGGVWQWYDREQARRDNERKQRAQDKLDAQAIKEKLDRELALAERAIEAEDARKAELARLNRLVSKNQDFIKSFGSERLDFVMAEALEKQTFSKMERLERELSLMREEEQFLLMAVQILVNQ